MKRKLIIEQDLIGFNDMPPTKKTKTRSTREIIIEKYNLEEVKATREWTEETFKITNSRVKGDTLEEKALQILRAQGIQTTLTKAHLLTEDEARIRLRKIIGDGGIDLFGEIAIQNQTLQWIGQCKMTKRLTSSVINEMKGTLSSRPNTIGIVIYGGEMDQRIETLIETANSDIFVCHIENLHTIKNQIENKYLQKGIRTMSVTRIHMEEIEGAEFDNQGRITKAKRIRNVNIQIWGTTTSAHKLENIKTLDNQ